MTEQQAMQKMGEDIRLRGLAASTLKNYTRNVKVFLRFCNRPIEKLDENDVRRFLEYLITKKKLAPSTVNQHSSAIRFFFAVGLNRYMNYLQIPLMKIPKSLPELLTKEEVSRLIGVCTNAKHKALLLLAYGSGLRSSEVVKLRVKDIDSREMRIFVKRGKSNRDHYTVLSQTTLDALRDYWRAYRPHSPEGWLFPGTKNVGHLTRAGVAFAFNLVLQKTNIPKEVSTHSLRHAFATHMLEDGVDLIKIKEMLGHGRINSTLIYLHLANVTKGIKSPADTMGTPND
jgi:site-specific recombinase XerD